MASNELVEIAHQSLEIGAPGVQIENLTEFDAVVHGEAQKRIGFIHFTEVTSDQHLAFEARVDDSGKPFLALYIHEKDMGVNVGTEGGHQEQAPTQPQPEAQGTSEPVTDGLKPADDRKPVVPNAQDSGAPPDINAEGAKHDGTTEKTGVQSSGPVGANPASGGSQPAQPAKPDGAPQKVAGTPAPLGSTPVHPGPADGAGGPAEKKAD